MPVDLLSFSAKPKEKSIRLDWETASEKNNRGFEIQRREEGRNFRKIGWVEGTGTITNNQKYQFEDQGVESYTEYYYRLKQIDEDGHFSYSKILNASIDGSNNLIGWFFPNPVSDESRLMLPQQGQWEVQLLDASGCIISGMGKLIKHREEQLIIDAKSLIPGLYLIRLVNQENVVIRKLMVQR